MHQQGWDVQQIVTFGAPRVLTRGHKLFDAIPEVVEYAYGDDPVPKLQRFTPRKHVNRVSVGPKPRWWHPGVLSHHEIKRYMRAMA